MADFTGELSATTSDVTAIAELAQRAAEPKAYLLAGPQDALIVGRVHNNEQLRALSLETHLPRPSAPRGAAVLHDPGHFVDYVNRLASPDYTTVWADVEQGTVKAVVDDHASWDDAGWREHTIALTLRPDPDWQHWVRRDRCPMSQVEFAQHVEDALHTITNPPAADMLEVASSLQAHRQADFSQAIRLDNGDMQLHYHEETTAKAGKNGALEVPRQFTLSITPWVGCPMIEVEARLRYQIQQGRLEIGYILLRPDLVQRDVFESIVATMRTNLTTQAVFNGTAPRALR